MHFSTCRAPRPGRVRPLAAYVAAMAALTAPAIVLGAAVTNCNDVGPGSLRAAITATVSGGTVDLTALACSTITLEDLQIVIPQQDLTIVGPRQHTKIVHDGEYGRIFNHQGTGTLKLSNLDVSGGDAYSTQDVYGGCIYSKGNVYLKNSSVTYCSVDGYGANAVGGGIFTVGNLYLISSTVAKNVAGSGHAEVGQGGGAQVGGELDAVQSSINNNSALGAFSLSGGVNVYNGFSISGSTISGNTAAIAGGLGAVSAVPGATGILDNSTISGNRATYLNGGAYLRIPAFIRNSTIAFNTATVGKFHSSYISPGLAVVAGTQAINVDLESSIISNNTYLSNGDTIENDFSEGVPGTAAVTVSGAHNLVFASLFSFAPNVVTVTSCPLLGPLRDNGGLTKTHALLSHSPAIDLGSNPLAQTYDQRGAPFKRADGGFFNFVDVGAYELQQEDIVFNTSFEGCPQH